MNALCSRMSDREGILLSSGNPTRSTVPDVADTESRLIIPLRDRATGAET